VVNGLAANVITAAATAADFTTEIQSGLATAAELAKVPKSDSNVTWNATALASLQQEATDALNAYDPPTAAELVSEINAVQSDIAALNNLSSAQAQTAAAAALTAYDPPTRAEATSDANSILTAVGDVPTNAELTTALGTADDAVLAQIALVKANTDKFANLPVLTAGGTGGQGYGAP
jgi:hypothetical protein